MAKAEQQIQRFDLSQGFLTEFTELTFPENATVDEFNMTVELDGSRRRRKGLDYETDHSLARDAGDPLLTTYAVSVHDWRNVGGSAITNFVVVQTGRYLHFYDKDASSFSDNKIADTVDLLPFKVTGKTDLQVKQSKVEAAYGRARLFVVGEYIEPIYITWDGTNFTATEITILERDFEGADDALGISARPNALSSEHAYNLLNQGWTIAYAEEVKSSQGVYPSNADIWQFGKYTDPSSGKQQFDPAQLTEQNFGNTPAPKGFYIRDVFDTEQSFSFIDRYYISSVSSDGSTTTIVTDRNHGFTTGDSITIEDTSFQYDQNGQPDLVRTYDGDTFTITVVNATTFTFSDALTDFLSFDNSITLGYAYDGSDNKTNPSGVVTDARPVSVAFFAGRTWWSGIPDDRLGNRIYFSQVLEYDEQIGRCYQQAAPTSEHINDLIDTDGGYLTISEMGQVQKMVVVGKNLIMFADNGVWNVGPGEDGYFTATSYAVRKVATMAITSPQAVVLAEGVPVVWTYQGIYGMTEDQISGFMQPQSMSSDTVQTFYRDIPDACKEDAAACYDDVIKKFYWSFSSDTNNPTKHDRILLFDARRQAFHKYSIGSFTDGPYVAGLSTVLGFDTEDNKVKLFTVRESDGSFTFSTFSEDTFHDWTTEHAGDGIDAEAYLISAYEAGSDIARDKQTPTITFLFKRTETGVDASGALTNPGSCFLQARWDWSSSDTSGKWNPERQIYRLRRTYTPASLPASDYEDGHPVVWSRNKVRGRGRALNFKLRSEESHDLHLLGWQIHMTGVTET